MRGLICALAFMPVMAWAGHDQGPGPQATENLASKRKIQAVLDAVKGVNDVVQAVRLESNNQYVLSVRNGGACYEALYKVKPVANKPATFTAQYMDLISSGACD
jgi:hypothetical protein